MYVQTSAGLGQPTLVVTGPDYIRWVQRSLNRVNIKRARSACLTTDGLVSQAYRAAVRRFQSSVGLTPNGQVNAQTQNALIKANERDFEYVLWVQTTLNDLRTGGFFQGDAVPVDGTLGRRTRDAIRAFQRQLADGTILGSPVSVSVDGVVGPKTEAVLALLRRSKPPDPCLSEPV
jgi:peptidoglycan hydrolase-like protein with peptidoglycan-binding domain